MNYFSFWSSITVSRSKSKEWLNGNIHYVRSLHYLACESSKLVLHALEFNVID